MLSWTETMDTEFSAAETRTASALYRLPCALRPQRRAGTVDHRTADCRRLGVRGLSTSQTRLADPVRSTATLPCILARVIVDSYRVFRFGRPSISVFSYRAPLVSAPSNAK
jgi:hypothetical protein